MSLVSNWKNSRLFLLFDFFPLLFDFENRNFRKSNHSIIMELILINKYITWQSYFGRIDFEVKYIRVKDFLKLNKLQKVLNIYYSRKNTFKTIHHLSCFVGHPQNCKTIGRFSLIFASCSCNRLIFTILWNFRRNIKWPKECQSYKYFFRTWEHLFFLF